MMPFRVDIVPSKVALFCVICLHFWLLLLWWLYFEWVIVGVLLSGLSVYQALRQLSWLPTKNSVATIFVEPQGTTSLRLGVEATLFAAKILDHSVASRFVLILHFAVAKGQRSVVIMPDSVAKETFRQLMVYTRLGGYQADDQSI